MLQSPDTQLREMSASALGRLAQVVVNLVVFLLQGVWAFLGGVKIFVGLVHNLSNGLNPQSSITLTSSHLVGLKSSLCQDGDSQVLDSQDNLVKNCKRPGHYARECPNVAVCNNCGVPGHATIARRLSTWVVTVRMSHVARQCPKSEFVGERGGGVCDSGYRDIVCRSCHQVGHMSRDCTGGLMICHNCGGRGHMAYECLSGRFMERAPRRYWHFQRRSLWAVMVDLLGRARHLEEALNHAATMPIEACGEHSLVFVGSMEILIREKGLRKSAGCSLMEAEDGIIHELFAGDVTHPKSKEIKEVLEELLQTSVGLLTTTAGTPIRIVKNLRVCEDFHTVMCGASLIMRREIVEG
ncbi:hypothetical protein IFM89_001845 [Coptis chinensis]|uniref:CCHC-type domain-containing protein n=1 Tax=Coptis chinensis TaxID=261450 RepID=A0A835HKA8_9MAGN|nr:hypothetical protein IFM89_001845 [Coptis chinensis]